MDSSHLTIHPIPSFKDNYIWAIIDDEQRTALIVDPGDAAPVLAFLKQHKLKLIGILITHHHNDHIGGITELVSHFPVPVFGPAKDHITTLTVQVSENDEIKLHDFPLILRVLEIPGHTLGHIAYYAPGILFCGDTLFAAGCGRVFEGTMEQMYQSLQKIAALPDDTKIYCAHEYTLSNLRFANAVEPNNKYIDERISHVTAMRNSDKPSLPSTLKDERETNPFLRCDSSEIITLVKQRTGLQSLNSIQIFSYLREWKNTF